MSLPHLARRGLLASTVAVLAGGFLSACGAQTPAPASPATLVPASAAPGPAQPTAAASAALAVAPPPGPSVGQPVQPVQPVGADRVDVDKCWTNATATSGGQLLVSARSSDRAARLFAYRADGRLIGEVQNGHGQRYGGTVFAWQANDPGTVTVRSSSGGSATVHTAPWRAEN
ncbi:hypothetical protein GCM10027039_00050 [Terrabacter koreensis]